MRIFGAGGGSGYASAQKEARYRSAAFRRSHVVGQIVSGVLLRWVKKEIGWVSVGGHELLAQLHSRPDLGQRLSFRIVQLDPQIILKQLDGEEQKGSLTPEQILVTYWDARDSLDSLLHSELWCNHPDSISSQAHRIFCQYVAETPHALSLFLRVSQARYAVNRRCLPQEVGFLAYQPWLLPRGRAVEYVVASQENSLTRMTAGAVLPDMGRVLLHLLGRSGKISYRIFYEREHFSEPLWNIAQTRDSQYYGSIQCLGTGGLPQGVHDVLTSLMHPTNRPYGTKLNTKT